MRMADDGEPNPLPWDSDPFPGWVDTVDDWPWHPLGDGDWEKHGDCPRCTHTMSAEKGGLVDVIATEADARSEMLASDDAGPFVIESLGARNFYVRCNCDAPHPGRPAGLKLGCGQAGTIQPPPGE